MSAVFLVSYLLEKLISFQAFVHKAFPYLKKRPGNTGLFSPPPKNLNTLNINWR